MEKADLRFGKIAVLYEQITGEKSPKQLDLIDRWLPGLVVVEEPNDRQERILAEYRDMEYQIHAVRLKGHYYSGGSTRISQILGRLIGTASGNQEKERKTAEFIRAHVADCFVQDMELTPRLQKNVDGYFSKLTEDQKDQLWDCLYDQLYKLAELRDKSSDYERKSEAVPMDDETFDGTIYSAAYQLDLGTDHGLRNCFLWLLLGGFLRNAIGRVLRIYDSSFIAVRRQLSEDNTLTDKLNYLFHPEAYEDTYAGDDLDHRFPGIEWYCDQCGAHLNEQEGFDDQRHIWNCTACGYPNRIEMDAIYENDEDWKNRIHRSTPQKFQDAIRRRKEEKGKEKKSGS